MLAVACASVPPPTRESVDARARVASRTLEQGLQAVTDSGVLEAAGEPLGERDRAVLRSVFADSLAVDRIRWVINAVEPDAPPRTVGNTLVLPPDLDPRDEEARMAPDFLPTLVHEAAHVWQYQHGGAGYVVDAMQHQLTAYARTGDRGTAYRYELTEATRFADLPSEPQAQLVMEWYELSVHGDEPRRCGNYESLGKADYLRLAEALLDRAVRPLPPDPPAPGTPAAPE